MGLSLLSGLLLLVGVYGRAQEPTKHQEKLYGHESGFLGDSYSKLQPDPGNGDWLTYFKTADVLKIRTRSFSSRLKIYLVPEAQQRTLSLGMLDKLSQYFTSYPGDELKAGHYKLVTEPGPGVMALRFAITNVKPERQQEEYGCYRSRGRPLFYAAGSLRGGGLLVPRLSVGRVSIEGEMVDSVFAR